MENISQMVDQSLARHGVAPGFDYLRLQWSRWFRCDSSFSVLLVPAKPGIFALAEEIMAPTPIVLDGNNGAERMAAQQDPNAFQHRMQVDLSRVDIGGSRVEQGFQPCIKERQENAALAAEVRPSRKRMLALFQITETSDLGMTLGRLFLPGNPLREKLETGKCFARFTVIEDSAERSAANEVFQRWLRNSAEVSFQEVA